MINLNSYRKHYVMYPSRIILKPGSIWGEGRNGLAPGVRLRLFFPIRPSPLKETTFFPDKSRFMSNAG